MTTQMIVRPAVGDPELCGDCRGAGFVWNSGRYSDCTIWAHTDDPEKCAPAPKGNYLCRTCNSTGIVPIREAPTG
jgi:hypothetical protein